MSNFQKSKRFDLIDKFNDTSRYIDDIFIIENQAFEGSTQSADSCAMPRFPPLQSA